EDEVAVATPLNVEFAPTKDEIKDDFNSVSDSRRIIRSHQFIQDQRYWPGIVNISENGERTGRSSRKASRNSMSPWIRTYKVKQDRNVVRKLLHSRPGSEAAEYESPQFMLE
ncbi:uncharacterized protein LOC102810181, partial [Saccoglossus kowalevskii]|uniref:Uncharacterized protein LOC102810181 n=1 Tax=Saccoglossus kowalevskii TaxID=10224 RepID=A0ABM0MRJ2_SACKO